MVVVVVGAAVVVVVVVGAAVVVVVVVGAAVVVVVVVGAAVVVVVSTGSFNPAGAFMNITVTHMNPSPSIVTPTPT